MSYWSNRNYFLMVPVVVNLNAFSLLIIHLSLFSVTKLSEQISMWTTLVANGSSWNSFQTVSKIELDGWGDKGR